MKILGGAAVAAAVGATLWVVARRARHVHGPLTAGRVLRLGFAVAVGVGAYWQEKLRQQELEAALSASGYLSPDPE